MTYKDVIKDSKFYLPMNLNLAYLISGDETVLLMTIINCHELKNKVSIRKLMKFCNVNSNSYMQTMIRHLRKLKMIEQNGYVPNYETLKYIFEKVNNAKSIDDRIKWCELYSREVQNKVYPTEVQNNVPLGGTQNCTPERYTYKEDVYKKDSIKKDGIYKENFGKKEFKIECKTENLTTMEGLMQYINDTLVGETESELINQKGVIMGKLNKNRIPMGSLFNRASSYLNRVYQEKLELVQAESK